MKQVLCRLLACMFHFWIVLCAVASGVYAFRVYRVYREIVNSDVDGSLHVCVIQTRSHSTGLYIENEVDVEDILGMSIEAFSLYNLGIQGTLIEWCPIRPHKATIVSEGFCPRTITIGRYTREEYDVELTPCLGDMCQNEECVKYRERRRILSDHHYLQSICIKSIISKKQPEPSISRSLGEQKSPMQIDSLPLEAQNEAANAVFAQTNAPSEAIAGWVADILDRTKDPAWRDYCLQFLGTALERNDLSDSDIRLARATLDATLVNTNGMFAGTALRSLRRAAVTHSDDALSAHVSSNALRIARDTAYSPESRTTALLILEESHSPATFSIARGIQGEAPSSPLLHKTAEAVVKRQETVEQSSLLPTKTATMVGE